MKKSLFILFLFFVCFACLHRSSDKRGLEAESCTYNNPLLPSGTDPYAIFYNGKYYYMQGTGTDKLAIWETTDITDIKHAKCKDIWTSDNKAYSFNIWGAELHRINNKWYIYFAADDGKLDNHQLYVLENESPDPMKGTFKMKGAIKTNNEWNWGIQATTIVHKGVQYLLWSGWPKRRITTETQCLYIASMSNPWTLESSRILISKPEYEWERQWVNPDGTRTAYPIYVNESPQFFHSRDNRKILIYYSASGCWTPYNCIGMLTANDNSDLLNPASWTKNPSPVFQQSQENGVYGPGSPCFVTSPDGNEYYILYHARNIPNSDGGPETRSPRIQKIGWDTNGMPVLGKPFSEKTSLSKPSGTF